VLRGDDGRIILVLISIEVVEESVVPYVAGPFCGGEGNVAGAGACTGGGGSTGAGMYGGGDGKVVV